MLRRFLVPALFFVAFGAIAQDGAAPVNSHFRLPPNGIYLSTHLSDGNRKMEYDGHMLVFSAEEQLIMLGAFGETPGIGKQEGVSILPDGAYWLRFSDRGAEFFVFRYDIRTGEYLMTQVNPLNNCETHKMYFRYDQRRVR